VQGVERSESTREAQREDGEMSAERASQSTASKADQEIDRLWLRGDAGALEHVHERYRSRLRAVAQRILGNRADAEDVVQRVFLSLRGARFEGRASLWTYLYRSAVNGSVNVLRSKQRREAAEQRLLEHQRLHASPAKSNPETHILEGEILAGVAKALLYVRPQHRRVLILRIMHGLSNTEIAEREGLPLATVGTWLRRGREELRRNMRPLLRDLGRGPS
jgi:RNA polymerase sigma-70 factor (ECF subfamily)